MILNSIAESLKKRDWSTLLLELLVVVLGIYIGLQVDDWNNSRKEQLEVDTYLARIQGDLEIDTDFFAFLLDEAISKRSALRKLKSLIGDGDSAIQDPEVILGLLADSASIGWEFPEVQTVTFYELQSSGKLALIDDTNLRRRLSFYYQESLHRSNRIESRLTGYAPALYEIVGAEVGLSGLDSALARNRDSAADENADLQEVVEFFFAAARKEKFMGLLNAEQNYTEFMMAQLYIQQEEIKALQNAISDFTRLKSKVSL
jgi:hypothetical protein